MKKRTVLVAAAMVSVLGVSALAAGVQSITAQQRQDYTVRVDGVKQTMRDEKGNKIYPITYNGVTYLPVEAVEDELGLDMEWDGKTQTVNLTEKRETVPTTAAEYKTAIAALDAKARQLVKDAAAGWSQSLENRAGELDREMDLMEYNLERDYRAGTLTAAQYLELDGLLDAADRQADLWDNAWDGGNYSGGDNHDDDHDDDLYDHDWDECVYGAECPLGHTARSGHHSRSGHHGWDD